LVEHLASIRKVAKSWFDARCCSAWCVFEKEAYFYFGAKQSVRRGGSAGQKTAIRIVLCWSGITDIEYNGPYEKRRNDVFAFHHMTRMA